MNGRVALRDSRLKRRIQISSCCRSVKCANLSVCSIVNCDKSWCIFSVLPTAAAEQALGEKPSPAASRVGTHWRFTHWCEGISQFVRAAGQLAQLALLTFLFVGIRA